MLSPSPVAGEQPATAPEIDSNPKQLYRIERGPVRVTCSVWRGHSVHYPLPHLVRHSPDGFEIGYGGSGPADLARCILADHLDTPDVEPRVYQAFKFTFLAHTEYANGRDITVGQIEQWLGVLRSQGFELEAAS